MRISNKARQQRRVLTIVAGAIATAAILAACAAPSEPSAPAAPSIDDARATAQSANTRLTAVERQMRQATAETQVRARATDDALRAAQQRAAIEVTRTANEQIAQATSIALDNLAAQNRAAVAATAQAATVANEAAALSARATATAIALEQDNAQRSAEWERTVLIPAKTIILTFAGLGVVACALYLLVRFGFKAIDTWVLHARVFRDGRGNIVIVTEPGRGGDTQYVQPHLSPSPVLAIGQRGGGAQLPRVEHSGGDPEVTRRAQFIDTLQLNARAAPSAPRGIRTSATGLIDAALEHTKVGLSGSVAALLDEPRINVMPAALPPAQVADHNALASLDADWRIHNG